MEVIENVIKIIIRINCNGQFAKEVFFRWRDNIMHFD